MTQDKHTPGPWWWYGNKLVSDTVTLFKSVNFWNCNDKDKQLIAAAPELLAACQSVFEDMPPHEREAKMRTAIAKATGAK